jgi:4-hydroxy-tetrahydrodipicolinate synthase
MPVARDAREWAAAGGLHGIGDSLYTPFSGPDGDDIDYSAYRFLVRYCLGDLDHQMLWLTSGVAEWWSLTTDERKRLTEVAIEEARLVKPEAVIQVCTASSSAKEAVELTRHAEAAGADICYLQTPPMEVHGGEGVLRFYRYVADRAGVALGIFNSPSSGYVLTPAEIARIYEAVPAVCALKQGTMHYADSQVIHRLAPGLVIWECDAIAYQAGWAQDGTIVKAQIGATGYLFETPDNRLFSTYWKLIWDGQLVEAARFARETGYAELQADAGSWRTLYPGRPGYFTHWGEAFRYTASLLGLPVGDYPHSRPPQAVLPEEGREQIRSAYQKCGLI